MTDPSDALALYQEAFAAGSIPLQPGTLDRDLFVAVDQPGGHVRFSYMRVDGKRLSVLVMFAQNGLVDGQPCFNIGYAVAKGLFSRGVMTAGTLVNAKSIRIQPPAVISEEQITTVLEHMDAALMDVRTKGY